MAKRYDMELTRLQADVIMAATDMFSALGTARLSAIIEHPDIARGIVERNVSYESVLSDLNDIKVKLFRVDRNAHFSLRSELIHDDCRIAWDVCRAIRRRLSWDRVGPQAQRDFHTLPVIQSSALKASSSVEPMPVIKRL